MLACKPFVMRRFEGFLEVRILKEVRARFLELRILKKLERNWAQLGTKTDSGTG